MKKYLVEFIGTFFLVLTIGCTVLPGAAGVIAPVAIGGVLMAMIYAGGHVSGAHYNPAVTLALFVRGKCEGKEIAPYVLAQVAGAVAAGFVAMWLTGKSGTPMVITQVPQVFVAEFLFTFALAYVILNVATAKAMAGNPIYGIAIGMTVIAGAFAVGGISGGAFNPAVVIGIATMKLVSFGDVWIHLVANVCGGLLAGLSFKMIHPTDR